MLIKTASNVNLDKYLGEWTEVFRIDFRWEYDNAYATAEYTVDEYDPTQIHVTNTAYDANGEQMGTPAKGVAKYDSADKSKLNVSFCTWCCCCKGDYWILEVGFFQEEEKEKYGFFDRGKKEYEYSIVCTPSSDYERMDLFWILVRERYIESPEFLFKFVKSKFEKYRKLLPLEANFHYIHSEELSLLLK